MANVHDVAAYILNKQGQMSAMKLHKLLYYCQAWSLVWDDQPMFPERIEAWANGPVVRELFEMHRGKFGISEWPVGNPAALAPNAIETIDSVLHYYGVHNAQWLSDLTHGEMPWKAARNGLAPDVRGDTEITLESMSEYYSTLPPDAA